MLILKFITHGTHSFRDSNTSSVWCFASTSLSTKTTGWNSDTGFVWWFAGTSLSTKTTGWNSDTSSVWWFAGTSLSTEITGWNWTFLTTSSAWNLQLGSRLQWLGPSTNLVVFNDRECHQPVLQTSRRLATSLDVQVCAAAAAAAEREGKKGLCLGVMPGCSATQKHLDRHPQPRCSMSWLVRWHLALGTQHFADFQVRFSEGTAAFKTAAPAITAQHVGWHLACAEYGLSDLVRHSKCSCTLPKNLQEHRWARAAYNNLI